MQAVKDFRLTLTGLRGYKEAIITQGGISVREINPSTMESKLVKGLYFAGEVLDLDAVTLHWEVVAEDVAIQEGWITDLAVAPHDSTVLTLPIAPFELQANTDYYINLTVCRKEDSLFAPAGHEIKKRADSDADPQR